MHVIPLLLAMLQPGPLTIPEGVDLVQEIGFALEPSPAARLSLRVAGAESGETTLSIKQEWGGARECWREVQDLRVMNSRAEDLPVTHDDPWAWRVQHEPGEALRVTYSLVPTREVVHHDDAYRPIVDARRIHLVGSTSFILPEHLDGETPRRIELRWREPLELGWTTACSFGTDAVMRVDATPSELRHAVYLAGADVVLRERECEGRRVVTAVSDDAWEFSADELAGAVLQIVGHERDFFGDHDFPYFLVTAIPVGEASEQGMSLGGTGLTNAFSLFLQPGLTLAPGSRHRRGMIHLLAHEYFHTWNGRVIGREQPEELVYWFSEGFTDYFTRRILLRSGLFSPADYLAEVNETLAHYAQSVVRHEPNERIRQDFWNDGEVQRLPYQRGAIVAMLCDHEIRDRTDGARSLDDLMLEITARARDAGEKIHTPGLLSTIARYTSPEFAERIRAVVEDGADLPPLPPTLEPDLDVHLMVEQSYRFDAGFDVDATRRDRTITGVRDDSAAHEAGLRDGQKLLGMSMYHGRVDKEVELVIGDHEGSRRTIRFLPRGAPVEVARYAIGATRDV